MPLRLVNTRHSNCLFYHLAVLSFGVQFLLRAPMRLKVQRQITYVTWLQQTFAVRVIIPFTIEIKRIERSPRRCVFLKRNLWPGMPRKYNAILLALVLGATYLLYISALGFPFVFDDRFQIVQNPHLSAWSYVRVYFTQDVWSHLGGAPGNLYRPLFLVWLRLNFVLFGHNPTGWHLAAILLHLIATGLVYTLTRKLLRDPVTALVAAFIFGVHPVHVEAVAWISGGTESLCAVLVLGAFLSYLSSLSGSRRRVLLWRVIALGLFALGILVKETAATLPLLLLLYELTIRQPGEIAGSVPVKTDFLGALKRVALFFVPIAAYFVARTMAVGSLLHKGSDIPLSAGLLRWPWLLCSYVRLLVWPINLSPLYDPVTISGLADLRFWLPACLLLAGGYALWHSRKLPRAKMAFFLAGWFLVTLMPALVISCVARPWEMFQDRYLYLPSVAFAIMAAIGVRRLFQPGILALKTATAMVGVVAVIALCLASWKQVQYWQSNYALFDRANTIAPHNQLGKLNLVHELIQYAEYSKALRIAEEAALLDPRSARAQDSAAWSAFYLKDYGLAEQHWSAATRMDPNDVRTWRYLGLSRFQLKNYGGAAAALENAIALDPKGSSLHYSRGLALARLNQWDAAREEFRQELTSDSQNQAALAAYQDAETHLTR